MVCEGAVKPGSHIGPALPIIRSGEPATRETNVQQARRNHHVSEFRSSSGVNGINTEFLHSRGDSIEVPNNFPGVIVRKWRGAQSLREYLGDEAPTFCDACFSRNYPVLHTDSKVKSVGDFVDDGLNGSVDAEWNEASADETPEEGTE
ncbi:hypothetical protein MRB53_005667 [Persea americana]|uniref:Uncharacterized protein n=1 Tax=Persea americana TaxID=3435 RepID=A0ACC2MEZ5_PERAE|nr:hypothetical protein MRB53_005667 [Persea americana]